MLPTATSVTIALRRAQINENPHSTEFLQQNLDNVYTFRGPRSYPLSSYSYLVVPRTGREPAPPVFSRARGRTLSRFLAFLHCPAGSPATSACRTCAADGASEASGISGYRRRGRGGLASLLSSLPRRELG